MSDCCNSCSTTEQPKKAVCPINGKSYHRVKRKTMLHHLRKPWQTDIPDQAWYFCDSPDCYVVYFGPADRIITQEELRSPIGQKSHLPERTLCYCFDVQQQDYDKQPNLTKDFVIDQTRSNTCDCEIRNPSGRCCLKDFPK